MTAIPGVHERYGGLLTTRGDHRAVAMYGRPDRTYTAVKNVAGVIEHAFGILTVSGPARRGALADALTNTLPEDDSGVYGFVLEDGTITADAYAFDVGDQLLGFVPSDRTEAVIDAWSGDDRTVEETTRDITTFGVYGPQATESIASVSTASPPETPLSISRGAIREAGVTVIRDDNVAGEEGYLLVVSSDDAEDVFDAMVNRGLNAAPFGYETWEILTLEAGTPLFQTELRDSDPATVGVANAFEDGDGPEPADRQLRGFRAAAVPDAGATVYSDGEALGHVTRSVEQPDEETAVGFAVVNSTADEEWSIGEDGIDGTAQALPFVETSDRSARIPRFQ